ncbi:MAG: aldehyde ferredoxin oxidoreductase N-terminal domain-containing protein [Anaerolineae bacterium]
MKPITVTLPRCAPRFGWANRLLRVDLSAASITAAPLDGYIPDYIGGRGVAVRLAWDEYPLPEDPFSPSSPLIIMTGALTGTRSPYSGRTSITGFSPQAYPYNWYTRANIGHHWGAALKRAGYDGLLITGAAESPMQLIISDDEVTLSSADDLWGLDTYDTQEALRAQVHKEVRALCIGPAGERMSRIATIHTGTSSTAGQGGFGAVMGSKKLKAISVLGSGNVPVHNPELMDGLLKAVAGEIRAYRAVPNLSEQNKALDCDRGGRVRPYACTASCPTPCNRYYSDMPGVAYPERRWEGHWACVGSMFRGVPEGGPISHDGLFDWQMGTYAGLELNVLSNRYGLNQWDIIMSMVPWLERCQQAGLISEMNGMTMDWQNPTFWARFLHDIAYREGLGDALAEGGLRASLDLNMGPDLARRYYNGWGFGGHWDGHACWSNYLVYPFWLVSALQWCTDTRDPYSSSHGYVQNVMRWSPFGDHRGEPPISWEQMKGISRTIYGTTDGLDPHSGYGGKAFPAFYHDRRSVMKDSLPSDDQVFPLIYSVTTDDRYFRVRAPEPLGEIEGPSVDHHLFRIGTGTDWDEAEFDRAAERIYTTERALCVRHFGRDRRMDETVLANYTYAENWPNPMLGERHALDLSQFEPVINEYYGHLGWDPQTGWPTRERMQTLGIGYLYDPMVEGAADATEQSPAVEDASVEQ